MTKLNLVNVIDTRSFASIEAYDRSIAERAQKFSEELLDGYKKQAETAGVKNVNAIIEYGSPKLLLQKSYLK